MRKNWELWLALTLCVVGLFVFVTAHMGWYGPLYEYKPLTDQNGKPIPRVLQPQP